MARSAYVCAMAVASYTEKHGHVKASKGWTAGGGGGGGGTRLLGAAAPIVVVGVRGVRNGATASVVVCWNWAHAREYSCQSHIEARQRNNNEYARSNSRRRGGGFVVVVAVVTILCNSIAAGEYCS